MRFWLIISTLIVAGLAACLMWVRMSDPAPQQAASSPLQMTLRRPEAEPNREYVQSESCRKCHPGQHASWHRTYHRTMTQVASPATVLAPFAGEILKNRGRTYELFREHGKLWVDMVDMDWDAELLSQNRNPETIRQPPRVKREIVMSTGSHNYQTYWVSSTQGNAMWQLPWVFHIAEQRWLPVNDAFVTPPHASRRRTIWNEGCIQCHSVNGQPGLDPESGEYDSRVAEFGISCEACHGPGKQHVDFHSGKAAEDIVYSDKTDPTIVNPAKLSSRLSSHVCGQCHSSFSFTDAEYFQTGFKYRPGDDLEETRLIHSLEHPYIQSRPDRQVGYWKDGTMRVGGREFAAMDDSACYKSGQLSCLSCHSMHNSDPNDQLASGMASDRACLQCHTHIETDVPGHTHHAPDSTGSRCYNCHMPHTSFALLKAIRTHRIDSPSATMTAQHGRPNACNLCHLDQTLAWTARHLNQWYGQPEPALNSEDQSVSSSLLMLLRGDAIQRSIIAWHFGWQPAMDVSGTQWQPLYLGFLLNDLYSAVRWVAYQSLRKYNGFNDFNYDFIASDKELATAPLTVFERWKPPADIGRNNVLLNEVGEMLEASILRYFRQRDDVPIQLPE